MDGEGEMSTRFRWEDRQLFIIQLNGQCFGFHRLYLTCSPVIVPNSVEISA